MIISTTADFYFDSKKSLDNNNQIMHDWETLMWYYQQAIPNSNLGEKWRLMNKTFEL